MGEPGVLRLLESNRSRSLPGMHDSDLRARLQESWRFQDGPPPRSPLGFPCYLEGQAAGHLLQTPVAAQGPAPLGFLPHAKAISLPRLQLHSPQCRGVARHQLIDPQQGTPDSAGKSCVYAGIIGLPLDFVVTSPDTIVRQQSHVCKGLCVICRGVSCCMLMRQDMVPSSIVGKRDSICADSEVPVQDWQGTYIKVEPGRVYRGVPVPEHQGQSLPAQRYEWQPQQPPLRNPFAGGA